MTISLAQSAGNTGTGLSVTVTIGPTQSWATPSVNSLLVIAVSEQNSLFAGLSPTDVGTPTGFTLAATSFGNAPDSVGKIFWKISNGTESTINCPVASGASSGSPNVAVEAMEFTGSSMWTMDTTNNNNYAATTNNLTLPATGTLASAVEVAVAVVSVNAIINSPYWNYPPLPFTLVRHGNQPVSVVGWAVTTSTASLAPTAFWNPPHFPSGAIVTFEAAGATATPTAVPLALTVPPPSLFHGTPVSPVAVPLSLTIPAPSFTSATAVSPPAVPLSLTIPSPTASVDRVTLVGSFLNDDGTPASGVLRFTMALRLSDELDDSITQRTSVEVALDVNGAFSVSLPTTDDPNFTPSPRFWQVTEFVNSRSRTYEIPLVSVPSLQYLADLAPPQ